MSLIVTLIITFLMSTLRFSGISQVLGPVLTVIYPALIVLTVVNLLYQLWGFKPVKTPVIIALALSLIAYFL
jgi:LIVCS family branched-chain amino acid:cation transporter